MASYADEASRIYDPQLQAEQTQLTRAKDSGLATLAEEEAKINPTYDRAVKDQAKIRNEAGARQDFIYSEALGGQRSGLLGNEQRLLDEGLSQDVADINAKRADEFAKTTSRKRSYLDDFTAGLSSLVSKYAGIKNQFVSGREAEDRDRQFQIAENDKARAATAANYASYAGDKKPDTNTVLSEAFQDYTPAKQGGKAFATEKAIAPYIQSKLGIDYDAALKLAYQYRKKVFGE